ncbi:MAG: hypothetical protein VKI81_10450 [Synechococcaceae cyanobacterium]|nr:hypothetical protein [Synechococcaceae cyanobacterium]
MGESLEVETFSSLGIKGRSQACPFREECSIEIMSKDLAWSFLQAATNTIANDATKNKPVTESAVLSTVDITPASTFTLSETPAAGTTVYVSDLTGTQYSVTVVGTAVTFDADYTGTKVTFHYEVAPAGTNNEIQLGAGSKLGEIGIYGRFYGCPNTLIVRVNRAIIDPNLELGVESDAATASLVAKALRDPDGNFAVIQVA